MPERDALTKTTFDKTLANDHPALLEWNPPLARERGPASRSQESTRPSPIQARYRGKVVLFTSTLNMDWNSWPRLRPATRAMMQENNPPGRVRPLCASKPAWSANPLKSIFLGGAATPSDAAVHFGDRRPQAAKAPGTQGFVDDVRASFCFADTDQSGTIRSPPGVRTARRIPVRSSTCLRARSRPGGCEPHCVDVGESRLAKVFLGWEFQVVSDPRLANYASRMPVSESCRANARPMGPLVGTGPSSWPCS